MATGAAPPSHYLSQLPKQYQAYSFFVAPPFARLFCILKTPTLFSNGSEGKTRGAIA